MNRPSGKSPIQNEEAKSAVSTAAERGISRWKLALGAASLFFFVVGVKRSFRTDDGREILQSDADRWDEEREQARLASRDSAATAATSGSGAVSRGRNEQSSRAGSGRASASRSERTERDTRSSKGRPGQDREVGSRLTSSSTRDPGRGRDRLR